MHIRNVLDHLLDRLREASESGEGDVPFSVVNFEHRGRICHAEAHARSVTIQRLMDGALVRFSTEEGAAHYELARAVFDGFEWDLTTLTEMIDLDERLRS